MRKWLNDFTTLAVRCFLTWAVTVGFIKLITMCFDVEFSLRIATGIWLIIWFIRWAFKPVKEAQKDGSKTY